MMPRKFFAAVLSCLLGAAALVAPGPATAQASSTGAWSRLQDLPVIPIHHQLLPTGKVMMFGRPGDQPYLLDPVTQALSTTPNAGYDLFCAGHAFLADGRMLVAGGHILDNVGLANTSVYDPFTNTWLRAPDMNAGRWYPTVTTLPNGDALVIAGQIDTTVGNNPLPQVYQAATNTWRDLTGAQLDLPMYPMMFVAPNGKVFMAGPSDYTRWLDTAGTGEWGWVGLSKFGFRDSGSAAMYADGKVLLVGGGGDPPKSTAEVIDLNVPNPVWRTVASMSVARRHHNATLLPDGTVLVTGGTSGPGFDNAATPVQAAELWNPATETWTTLASASVPRIYHSTALLLPDGRVLTGGGDGNYAAEVFSPPYLFKGARPAMSAVPASIGYGQQFTVQSPDAASIQKVTLIRLPSVTHAFDQNQRMNILSFTPGSGTVGITAPPNANMAPPGHYMLFLVNGLGVPSLAAVVQLGTAAPPPPPPPPADPVLGSLAPNSATAGGAAFTLTANGSNFASGATVLWNGGGRSTTYVSGTQLRAAIAAADIAAAGTAQVTVLNPGGAVSGALPFTITATPPPPPATPALGSLAPSNATAGGPAFTLTANGSNFVSGATVLWNGGGRSTTFVSGTQLTAAIGAADIAAAGTAQVSVVNPGGTVSGSLPFTVTAAAPTTFSLTVTKNGTAPGKGNVTSTPAGISCGSICTAAFGSGGTVTLNVHVNRKASFAGWGGACTGTATTCTVTMNANKTVTATINNQ
ncbi:MAG TPA: galactose oxidase-like domain-containing protein [Ramlibacter sp.]|nr:galactose oxidase-like domain-containing protein [Ramlibacter sp.]